MEVVDPTVSIDLLIKSIRALIAFTNTIHTHSASLLYDGIHTGIGNGSYSNLSATASRHRISLASSSHFGEDPNQQGNSRRWLIRAVEDSLRRLQTDHIDLYMIHRPAPDTDIEETLSVLTDLLRAGKVRAIGSSTFPVSEIVEAQWVAERRGLARFRTEQPPYSILNRGIEREANGFISVQAGHGRE
jgi:aryl-alcohol dehydrogenase-like predicted oxidoreductase